MSKPIDAERLIQDLQTKAAQTSRFAMFANPSKIIQKIIPLVQAQPEFDGPVFARPQIQFHKEV